MLVATSRKQIKLEGNKLGSFVHEPAKYVYRRSCLFLSQATHNNSKETALHTQTLDSIQTESNTTALTPSQTTFSSPHKSCAAYYLHAETEPMAG